MLDDDDLFSRRNILVGETNTFICILTKVDESARNILFTFYGSSYCGTELYDLANRIDDYCIAWRKQGRNHLEGGPDPPPQPLLGPR